MASDTRQSLVNAALRRFYRDGFRNVGLDQILRDVGISKTAFYKHFESKDELMQAVLESQSQTLQNTFRQLLRELGGRSAVDQLRAVFDVVGEIVGSEDFRGCIFVNAAMEFPLPHDPAHREAARNKEAIQEIVQEIAEYARARDSEALARELCLIMDGAYVGRQVSGDADTIDVARRLADRAIAAWVP